MQAEAVKNFYPLTQLPLQKSSKYMRLSASSTVFQERHLLRSQLTMSYWGSPAVPHEVFAAAAEHKKNVLLTHLCEYR